MNLRHRLIACAVAIIWGVNFLAIHASLTRFPPLFLVALRFTLIAVPTVMFVPRPAVRWRWLIGYGLGFGVLQFTFLYTGMALGMPAGIASLVLQASGPITLVLGAVFLSEPVRRRQWLGILIAVGGLALVGAARAAQAGLLPFLLVLAGAAGWALGNLANRQARPDSPLRLTLWMSVVVPVPMLLGSLAFEGPPAIAASLSTSLSPLAIPAWVGLGYTVVVGTIVGSGLWTWLMSRHPAGVVAPFSMLVPVVGIATAAAVLGEVPSRLELAGGVLVVAGVLVGASKSLGRRVVPVEPGIASAETRVDELSASS